MSRNAPLVAAIRFRLFFGALAQADGVVGTSDVIVPKLSNATCTSAPPAVDVLPQAERRRSRPRRS